MMNHWILLMGAGDIAHRLQPLLSAQGFNVAGARRNPPAKTDFPHIRADARKVEDWRSLLAQQPEVIVLTLVPTAFSEEGYQQGYVEPIEAMLKALQDSDPEYLPLILFVSSTSVYSERDGEWVDESTATEPDSFAGIRLLEAENLLRASAYPHTIVRFSGIYGPGREGMVARLMSGELTVTPAWTNRIHVKDCAGVLSHLVQRFYADLGLDDVYVASDNLPIRQAEFVEGLATIMGVDASSLPVSDKVGPRGSKRCNNARLVESGYRFMFPTWKEGYESL